MERGTAIAYGIMLLLTPGPNIAIYSYYKEKPLLTKVLCCHVLCMFLLYRNNNYINWKRNRIIRLL
jgi:hypothetical protein